MNELIHAFTDAPVFTDSCFGFIPDEYLSGGVKGNICSDQLDCFSAYSKLSSQQTRVEVTVKGIWKTE